MMFLWFTSIFLQATLLQFQPQYNDGKILNNRTQVWIVTILKFLLCFVCVVVDFFKMVLYACSCSFVLRLSITRRDQTTHTLIISVFQCCFSFVRWHFVRNTCAVIAIFDACHSTFSSSSPSLRCDSLLFYSTVYFISFCVWSLHVWVSVYLSIRTFIDVAVTASFVSRAVFDFVCLQYRH